MRYFSIAGRRLWAQYSTYLKGGEPPGCGVLILQILFIESASRPALREDIVELSDAVHEGFVRMVGTVGGDDNMARSGRPFLFSEQE